MKDHLRRLQVLQLVMQMMFSFMMVMIKRDLMFFNMFVHCDVSHFVVSAVLGSLKNVMVLNLQSSVVVTDIYTQVFS